MLLKKIWLYKTFVEESKDDHTMNFIFSSPQLISSSFKKQINVQVYSKTITLPENKAVLTAFAIPEPAPTNPFNYEWSLISGPSMENAGNMENRY